MIAEVFNISEFLFQKMLSGGLLLIGYFWVLAFLAIYLASTWPTRNDQDRYVKPNLRKAFSMGIVTILFLIVQLAFLNSISRGEYRGIESAKDMFFRSYSEFKIIKNIPAPTKTFLPTQTRRFQLISYQPPKHFYVTLRDMKTGAILENLYVAKHCNNYSENKLGTTYTIKISPYTRSDKPNVVFYTLQNLSGVFC